MAVCQKILKNISLLDLKEVPRQCYRLQQKCLLWTTAYNSDLSKNNMYRNPQMCSRTILQTLPNSSVLSCLSCQRLLFNQNEHDFQRQSVNRFHSINSLHNLARTSRISDQYHRIAVYYQSRNLSLSPAKIVTASPRGLQPYMRLIRFDKPIGTWLLFWPCTWSIALAATPGCLPDFWLLTLFGMGSFFMRGAGCIINDMWDKDFDRKVERTKLRPLASGELSQFQGLSCLAGMLSVSLGILLQLNYYSIILGASSMLLVIMYPLAKRYTFWPQAMLGVTLNWGVLLAWSAIHGSLEFPVIPLYIGCVLYTMTYDSIYAHQDKYDDMLIGVKSTALKFGDNTKPWLSGFATTMITGISLTGYLCEQTWPFYGGVAFIASHLAHQIYSVDLNNADDCAKKFRSNSWIGVVLFLSIIAGNLLKKTEDEKEADKPQNETVNMATASSKK